MKKLKKHLIIISSGVISMLPMVMSSCSNIHNSLTKTPNTESDQNDIVINDSSSESKHKSDSEQSPSQSSTNSISDTTKNNDNNPENNEQVNTPSNVEVSNLEKNETQDKTNIDQNTSENNDKQNQPIDNVSANKETDEQKITTQKENTDNLELTSVNNSEAEESTNNSENKTDDIIVTDQQKWEYDNTKNLFVLIDSLNSLQELKQLANELLKGYDNAFARRIDWKTFFVNPKRKELGNLINNSELLIQDFKELLKQIISSLNQEGTLIIYAFGETQQQDLNSLMEKILVQLSQQNQSKVIYFVTDELNSRENSQFVDKLQDFVTNNYYLIPNISLTNKGELSMFQNPDSFVSELRVTTNNFVNDDIKKAYSNLMKQIISLIDKNMSVEEKVFLVTRYITDYVVYKIELENNQSEGQETNLHTALKNFEAVCKEYVDLSAMAFSLLNIKFVVQTGEQHTWLMVQNNNGEFAYVDPTHMESRYKDLFRVFFDTKGSTASGLDSSNIKGVLFAHKVPLIKEDRPFLQSIYKNSDPMISENQYNQTFIKKIVDIYEKHNLYDIVDPNNVNISAMMYWQGHVYFVEQNMMKRFSIQDKQINDYDLFNNLSTTQNIFVENRAINYLNEIYFIGNKNDNKYIYQYNLSDNTLKQLKQISSDISDFKLHINALNNTIDFYLYDYKTRKFTKDLSIDLTYNLSRNQSYKTLKNFANFIMNLDLLSNEQANNLVKILREDNSHKLIDFLNQNTKFN
ncbi:hypothetical protein V2E24_02310 [Mycoplasmopsis ciconiae]|uniref:Lipoprotein n=1 Tax=Mycoplasmopsis ciconiae TaxID=561067 RepID=A0ABU7MLQ3_9BACT|nr:hypothetical protein [Mycoplasmopsis ciconiae]